MGQGETGLRARLVAVGVDLVNQEGIQALSLREIARRAGVSHGAPRRYFPTHLELLSSIAREGFATLTAAVEQAMAAAPPTPRHQLAALSHAYLDFARSHRGMFDLMVRHDLLKSGYLGLRDVGLPLFETLVGLIIQIRPEFPEPVEDSARITAGAFWANLHGIAQLWTWGSLGLATGHEDVTPLVTCALDTYLAPRPQPGSPPWVGSHPTTPVDEQQLRKSCPCCTP